MHKSEFLYIKNPLNKNSKQNIQIHLITSYIKDSRNINISLQNVFASTKFLLLKLQNKEIV